METPTNTLHWGHRHLEDHVLLGTIPASMVSVPVTVRGHLTDAVVRRLQDTVEARSTPGALFWLDEIASAKDHGGVRGATHVAWVMTCPR